MFESRYQGLIVTLALLYTARICLAALGFSFSIPYLDPLIYKFCVFILKVSTEIGALLVGLVDKAGALR